MTRYGWTGLLSGLMVVVSAQGVRADDEPTPVEPEVERTCTLAWAPCVDPKRPGRFELGLGIDPDEDLVFGARVINDNLFGTGHGLSLAATLSSRRQDFTLRYDARRILGTDFDLTTEMWNRERRYHGFTREGVGGSMTLSRPIAPHTRMYVGYRLEEVAVDVGASSAAASLQHGSAGPLRGPFDGGLVASVRTGLIYDSLGQGWWRRAGTRAELYAERADPGLGSDVRFGRAGASLRHHRPLGPLTLRLSGAAEAILAPSGQTVPLAERLQLEGHAHVRGFGYGTAGPMWSREGDTVGVGGNLRGTARAELEVPIYAAWGLHAAVFYDAGIVRDLDGLSRNAGGLHQSAGLGLIWRSPIGDVRVDLAQPFGDERSGPQLLFSIGGVF